MILVKDNSPESINAALLSAKKEIEAAKNSKGNVSQSQSQSGGGGGTSTTYKFVSPLKNNKGTVSVDTTGIWEGSARSAQYAQTAVNCTTADSATISEKATSDGSGNNIEETYLSKNDANYLYLQEASKGEAGGIAPLDDNGRIPYQYLPESAMEFKGTWNALSNTPELVQGVGTNGDFYVVSQTGTWSGVEYIEGDRIIFDGSTNTWIKLSSGEVVTKEVFYEGTVGTIVASAGDISIYGYVLCDGRALSKADYAELYAVVGNKYGETETTFNIPNIDKIFIEGTTDPSKVGTKIQAGIPNITGTFSGLYGEDVGTNNGAFRTKSVGSSAKTMSTAWNGARATSFSAANGEVHSGTYRNDVYGKSDTVQPESICFFYYIKAKNIEIESTALINDSIKTIMNTWSSDKISKKLETLDEGLSTDASLETRTITHVDANTLNTPYKEGLTSTTDGLLITRLSSSTNYGQQLCMTSGLTGRLYVRRLGNGTWSSWIEVLTQDAITLLGDISYKGTKNTYSMIRFIDNTVDIYGNGVSIGGGGATIIGGGESASNIQKESRVIASGGDEKMIIANDTVIEFFTNCQNGIYNSDGTMNAVRTTINANGHFTGTANVKLIKLYEGNYSTANSNQDLLESIELYSGVIVVGTGYANEQGLSLFIPKQSYYLNTTNPANSYIINGSISGTTRRLYFGFDKSNPRKIYTGAIAGTSGYLPRLRYVFGIQ